MNIQRVVCLCLFFVGVLCKPLLMAQGVIVYQKN